MSTDKEYVLKYTLEEFEAEVKDLFPGIPFVFSQRSGFAVGREYSAKWQHTVITRRPGWSAGSVHHSYSISAEGQVAGFGSTLPSAAADAAKALFYSVNAAKPLHLERFLPADANDE